MWLENIPGKPACGASHLFLSRRLGCNDFRRLVTVAAHGNQCVLSAAIPKRRPNLPAPDLACRSPKTMPFQTQLNDLTHQLPLLAYRQICAKLRHSSPSFQPRFAPAPGGVAIRRPALRWGLCGQPSRPGRARPESTLKRRSPPPSRSSEA